MLANLITPTAVPTPEAPEAAPEAPEAAQAPEAAPPAVEGSTASEAAAAQLSLLFIPPLQSSVNVEPDATNPNPQP